MSKVLFTGGEAYPEEDGYKVQGLTMIGDGESQSAPSTFKDRTDSLCSTAYGFLQSFLSALPTTESLYSKAAN